MNDIPGNREGKALTEEELQFCELYVNGGLEFAGRPKKCYVEVFGGKAAKNPHSSANYLIHKPHVLAHIKALLSSEPVGIIRRGGFIHDGFQCLGHLQLDSRRFHLEPFGRE